MIAGEIVDCLANYFGFNDEGELARYFCYHILGGPGPTPERGVASIVVLSVYDETERCIGCQNVHFVETGGPAAAVAKAPAIPRRLPRRRPNAQDADRAPRPIGAGLGRRSINRHCLAHKEKSRMNVKRLGKSDLNITPMGFGAWAIGGAGCEWGWGAQDDARLHRRHSRGARRRRQLDRHRRRLRARPLGGGGRPRPRRASGSGPTSSPSAAWSGTRSGQIGNSLKADSIRRECEASLRRLGVDAIDLYQIHWPKPPTRTSKRAGRRWPNSSEEGKVRWIGVSNFNVDQMRAGPGDRPDHVAAAAVLAAPARKSRTRSCPTASSTTSA